MTPRPAERGVSRWSSHCCSPFLRGGIPSARRAAQQIAHERIADGSTITAADAILRQLAHEKPELFIEIAFGKVPDETVNSGEIKHTIRIEYVDAATAAPAPSVVEDQA